jgi:hypothetical protein
LGEDRSLALPARSQADVEGQQGVESALPALASREEGRADILGVIQTVQGAQWSALTSRPKKDRTSPRRSDIQLK